MTQREIVLAAIDGMTYRIERATQQSIELRESLEPTDVLPVAKPVKVRLPKVVDVTLKPKKKRRLSPEARERIAQAQVTRWQKHRAAKTA